MYTRLQQIKQKFQNQETHISPIKTIAEGNVCEGQIGGIKA